MTGILDSGVRANESPITGWTDSPDGTTYGGMRIVSNKIASITTDAWNYWNAATYGPDCEVYATVDTLPGGTGTVALDIRLAAIGTAGLDGYELEIRPDLGVLRFYRIDNNVNTKLGADFTQAFAAGDSFGIEAVGSTFTIYYRSGAGAWTSLGTRSDATYSAAGYLASYISNTTARMSNFGGGTRVITGATATSIVVTPASAGVRKRLGATATSIIVTPASAGVRTRFGATATSIIVTPASAGVRTRFGATATPIAVTVATAGIRSRAGASATTITVTETTSGTRTRFGATATPVVFTITTAIGATLGASASTFAFSITTNGTRKRLGATATAIIVTPASAGVRTRLGATATSIIFTPTSSATRTGLGATATAIVVTFGSSGTRKRFGATATPVVFSIASSGLNPSAIFPARVVGTSAPRVVSSGFAALLTSVESDAEQLATVTAGAI